MSAVNRFFNLWRRRSLDRDFDDELRFHFETRTEANIRAGMTRVDAEAEARRHLGSTLRAKEGMHDARGLSWIWAFGRDLRQGVRMFGRQPGMTALAVLTLSLGIGANAVIFSLLHVVLLRPLPFSDPDRLVTIVDGFRASGTTGMGPTVPEIVDVRTWSRNLDGVSFYDTRDFQIAGGDEPARVFAARVEASFLTLLGVRPALGRLFVDGENVPGRDRVVVLTDGLWRRNFGGDPAVVGHQIVVNSVASTIVGVLPHGFSFNYLSPEPIELYVPFPMSETYTSRNAAFANVRRVMSVARLKRGINLTWASAELRAISRALATEHAGLYRRSSDGQDLGFFMEVQPLQETLVGRSRPILLLLFGAVSLVLLVACVNTAQFLLARAIERQPEVAIRRALGASRARLLAQFLSEALLLGVSGGAIGLLQTAWLMKALLLMIPSRASGLEEISINGTVLAFTMFLALATTVAFGLLPALHFSRTGLGAGKIRGLRIRTRQILIVVEVAVSVVLLVGVGLLMQSLRDLQRTPRGYSADDVMAIRMRVSAGTATGGPTGPVTQRYLERITTIASVAGAAVADAPLPGFADVEFFDPDRSNDAATLSRQLASYRIISPDYFSVLRIPIREGRAFRDDDIVGRPPVAIVNEEIARRLWPGQSAIGRRIRSGTGPRTATMMVVGVVDNVRPILQTVVAPQIYVSYLQQSEPNMNLLVRTAAGAVVSLDAIKKAVWSVVPSQPVFDIRSMAEVASRPVDEPRTIARLLGSFALLAVWMSAMGVYTVVTYLTSGRTKEIAIRRAIGANTRDVLALLTGQTMRWTVFGLAVGVAAAVAASGALRAAVIGVTPLNAATVVIVVLIYLVVVALAACTPAVRALGLDPAAALRTE